MKVEQQQFDNNKMQCPIQPAVQRTPTAAGGGICPVAHKRSDSSTTTMSDSEDDLGCSFARQKAAAIRSDGTILTSASGSTSGSGSDASSDVSTPQRPIIDTPPQKQDSFLLAGVDEIKLGGEPMVQRHTLPGTSAQRYLADLHSQALQQQRLQQNKAMSPEQQARARQQIRADLAGIDQRALKGPLRDLMSNPNYAGEVPGSLYEDEERPSIGSRRRSNSLDSNVRRSLTRHSQEAMPPPAPKRRKKMRRDRSGLTVTPQEAFLDYNNVEAVIASTTCQPQPDNSAPMHSIFAPNPPGMDEALAGDGIKGQGVPFRLSAKPTIREQSEATPSLTGSSGRSSHDESLASPAPIFINTNSNAKSQDDEDERPFTLTEPRSKTRCTFGGYGYMPGSAESGLSLHPPLSQANSETSLAPNAKVSSGSVSPDDRSLSPSIRSSAQAVDPKSTEPEPEPAKTTATSSSIADPEASYGESDEGSEEEQDDGDDSYGEQSTKKRKSTTTTATRQTKNSLSATITQLPTNQTGMSICDYVSPLTQEYCGTEFHRLYDLARHRETIHAKEEAKAIREKRLTLDQCVVLGKEVDPKRSTATVEWKCEGRNGCGSIFSVSFHPYLLAKDSLLTPIVTHTAQGCTASA